MNIRLLTILALAPTVAFARPAAIESLIGDLPNTTPAEVAAMAEARLDAPQSVPFEDAWWHLVFYRWCEVDRPAAGAFAMRHDALLRPLLLSSIAQDASGAAAFADSLGEGAADLFANLKTGESLSTVEVTVAPGVLGSELEAIFNDPATESTRPTTLRELLAPLAKADPAATLEQIRAIPLHPDDQRLLMDTFMKTLGEAEPSAVARIFDELPMGVERAMLSSGRAQAWASKDPEAAMAWAKSLSPGPGRDAAMIGAASGREAEDPLAILAFLDEHGWRMDFHSSALGESTNSGSSGGGGSGNRYNHASMVNVLPRALRHLVAEGRATDALARVAQVPDRKLRDDMFRNTIETWIKQDGAAATGWLTSVPSDLLSDYRLIADGLDSVAATGDSAKVTELMDAVGDAETRRRVAQNFAKNLAGRDPGAIGGILGTWAQSLPDEERPKIQLSVANGLTDVDPAAGAAFLVASDPEATSSRSGWSRIARGWGRHDPEAATRFFAAHEASIPSAAFGTLTTAWVSRSPEASSAWVAGLSPGAPKDAAVESLVNHLSRGSSDSADFEAALVWSAEISDPSRSQTVADAVLKKWLETNPASAPAPR
ncbi:hypothetical protein BH23VER1_BH23VER1_19880 [soil metagenome]